MKEEKILEPMQPWVIGNHLVVWATHPDTPNWDDTSRSRKFHLAVGVKTLCGMLTHEIVMGVFAEDKDRICGNCMSIGGQS